MLRMRSMRRGIKEMDIILSRFAEAELSALDAGDLDDYEALLSENDQDLYLWVSGQAPVPERFKQIVQNIVATLPGN